MRQASTSASAESASIERKTVFVLNIIDTKRMITDIAHTEKERTTKMTDEEKIYLQELNYSFADGFTRGYSRGFLDGLAIAAQVKADLVEQIKEELND